MYLAKFVFAVFACTLETNYIFVSGDDEVVKEAAAGDDEVKEIPEEKTDPPPLENHSFVALIDILYTDGSKRSCTGTIVHDKVVVTAAHCFYIHSANFEVELSGSYVVIGSKKMFETGYENYLPIERIMTHPRYKGWTADLALVFTFVGMTTEKPGKVIPIVGSSTSTPVDSNVTILSWGQCSDDRPAGTQWPSDKKRHCTSSEEDHDSCEPSTARPLRMGSASSEQLRNRDQEISIHRAFHGDTKFSSPSLIVDSTVTTSLSYFDDAIKNVQKLSQDNAPQEPYQPHELNEAHPPHELNQPKNPLEPNETQDLIEPIEPLEANEPREPYYPNRPDVTIGMANQTISTLSFDVTAGTEAVKNYSNITKTSKSLRKRRRYRNAYRKMPIKFMEGLQEEQKRAFGNMKKRAHSVEKASESKNRRRSGKSHTPKENKLTVENFGFVNVQSCKKLVDKALPPLYDLNPNEVVCYAAEEHYISDDDSGAPAVSRGHLVAVTVGGVESDGDHVAIGMKMSCFCSWIVENLPEKNVNWECCHDCCQGDEPKKPPRKLRTKHKN